MTDGYDYFLAASVEQHYQRELAYVAAIECYFTQEYREDGDMSDGEWNAEAQAYADCEVCGGQGYAGGEVDGCPRCLKQRIADLEAQLVEANERADVYEFSRLGPIQESRNEWKGRAEKAEAQRDDLAAALSPFALAVREMPSGIYCSLRFWNGTAYGFDIASSMTTDHLLAAADALARLGGDQ